MSLSLDDDYLPKSLRCVPKIMCRLTEAERSCGSCPLTEAEYLLRFFLDGERRMRGHALQGKDLTVCARARQVVASAVPSVRRECPASRARFRQARYEQVMHVCDDFDTALRAPSSWAKASPLRTTRRPRGPAGSTPLAGQARRTPSQSRPASIIPMIKRFANEFRAVHLAVSRSTLPYRGPGTCSCRAS